MTTSDWQRVERRIGNRLYVADDLELRWVLPKKKRAPEWLGRMAVVSVSGALIHASNRLPVQVGQRVTVRYGEGATLVTIVRAEPTDLADTTAFAVEFVDLDQALRARIFHILSTGRPYEASTT